MEALIENSEMIEAFIWAKMDLLGVFFFSPAKHDHSLVCLMHHKKQEEMFHK